MAVASFSWILCPGTLQKNVQEWIEEYDNEVTVDMYPPNDLIENLWNLLDKQVSFMESPTCNLHDIKDNFTALVSMP